MPRYFFHLRFGKRLLPDEEGIELPNRSAARDEALGAVCELADTKTGRPSRRWAGWFLQVTDEFGEFTILRSTWWNPTILKQSASGGRRLWRRLWKHVRGGSAPFSCLSTL